MAFLVIGSSVLEPNLIAKLERERTFKELSSLSLQTHYLHNSLE